MEKFTKVCRVDQLKDRLGKRFIIDDVDVAVFKVDDEIYAVNNVCPHQLAAVISDGFVEDCTVHCPVHGWQFDLRTGILVDGIRGLDSYETKIENDDVYVKVYQKKLNW